MLGKIGGAAGVLVGVAISWAAAYFRGWDLIISWNSATLGPWMFDDPGDRGRFVPAARAANGANRGTEVFLVARSVNEVSLALSAASSAPTRQAGREGLWLLKQKPIGSAGHAFFFSFVRTRLTRSIRKGFLTAM